MNKIIEMKKELFDIISMQSIVMTKEQRQEQQVRAIDAWFNKHVFQFGVTNALTAEDLKVMEENPEIEHQKVRATIYSIAESALEHGLFQTEQKENVVGAVRTFDTFLWVLK